MRTVAERSTALVCAALLLSTGCFVTRPGEKLPVLQPSPAPIVPSIETTLGDWRLEPTEFGWDIAGRRGRRLNDALLDRWQEQGLISGFRVVKDSAFSHDARHRLTLSGLIARDPASSWNLPSVLTLRLIPGRMRDTLDLRYSLLDAETGCVFTAHVRDSYTITHQLFLIFALPIAERGLNETYDRLSEHAWERLKAQGAFDPHPPCAAGAGEAEEGAAD